MRFLAMPAEGRADLMSILLGSRPPYRIFLVDDHPLVREWLGKLIALHADLKICGEAESVAEAYEAIARLRPDLAIVDLSLGASSGLDLITQLQGLPSPTKVIVLSMHDELSYGERAVNAGASGYVEKRAVTGTIIQAIRQVLVGKLYFSPELSTYMTTDHISRRSLRGQPFGIALSGREREVFLLVGQGKGTQFIAESLNISPKTVQVYCGRIKEKLGLVNGRALVLEAIRWAEKADRDS